MSTIRKLRELLRSDDLDTCMQGVELARSMGDEIVSQLLARTRVVVRPTVELFSGARRFSRSIRYPKTLPVVVPGTGLRGGPQALRVATALALATGSTCRTARKLRTSEELALLGWLEDGQRMPLDLSVLRDFELRSLVLLEATELRGVEVLGDLPLDSLRISGVDAYDLSGLELPQLRNLMLEGFELTPTPGTRFAPRTLTGLHTLRLHSNPFMLDLDACADMKELRVLVSSTAKHVHDPSPIAGLSKLRELRLGYSQITDISTLPESLEELYLPAAKELVDITAITRLKKLRRLELSYTKIRDYRPLLELPNLEALKVRQTKIALILPPELQTKADAWS